MKNFHKKINKKKGFVMLFAVLISTLVLSVGVSVISIALKQVVLSGTGRESQYAFYAANTGTECAMYWDFKQGTQLFSTSTPPTYDANIKCLGYPIMDNDSSSVCNNGIENDTGWCRVSSGVNQIKTKFRIKFDNEDQKPCADVIVTKTLNQAAGTATTTILSRGYNTCGETNPRRVERALEYNY